MAVNAEQAQSIIQDLSQGLSLRKACVKAGVKHPTDILELCERDTEFDQQYARARILGYKLLADEILEISDEVSADFTGEKPDPEMVARSRLRVDSRKWMLSKMLPKIYGDKLDLNHSGYIATPKEMTEEELARIASAGK